MYGWVTPHIRMAEFARTPRYFLIRSFLCEIHTITLGCRAPICKYVYPNFFRHLWRQTDNRIGVFLNRHPILSVILTLPSLSLGTKQWNSSFMTLTKAIFVAFFFLYFCIFFIKKKSTEAIDN